MLNRLYFRHSTYKMLSMETREGIPILPISVIFPLPMPPKEPTPPSTGFRLRNIDLSSVMCREQPLSRYQLKPWLFPTNDIYNRNNLSLWHLALTTLVPLDICFFLWMHMNLECPDLPQKSYLSGSDCDSEEDVSSSKPKPDLSWGC